MGGTKKKLREQATTSSGRAASEDRTRAVLLSDQLDQRRSALTGSVYGGGTEGAGFGAASTNPAIATPQRSGQQIHQWLLENPTPARGMDEEWNSYANTPEGREFLTLHATNREKAKDVKEANAIRAALANLPSLAAPAQTPTPAVAPSAVAPTVEPELLPRETQLPTGIRTPEQAIATNPSITGNFDVSQQASQPLLPRVRESAEGLRETGGFNPVQIEEIRKLQEPLGNEEGYGTSYYEDFARTGGYSPAQETAFMRSATAPSQAIYARTKDEMGRRMALQGGYAPGFDESSAKLTRQAGQQASELGASARSAMDERVMAGRRFGVEGLSRVRQAIGSERLAKAQEARGLETSIAAGRGAGDDALARYLQIGVSAINQNDVLALQNRLQTGNMSMADASLLAQLSMNEKGLFDKIMQGVGTVAGAIGGIAPAFA